MVAALALTLVLVLGQTAPPPPPASDAPVAEAPPTEASRAFAFAEYLLAEGDHYRAIGEYKRSLFLEPRGTDSDAARFAIGIAYLRGGQADAAAQHFKRTARDVSPPLRPDATLQAAYARYVGGQFPYAYEELSGWLTRDGPEAPESSRARARYLLGWTQLELGRFPDAASSFEQIEFGQKPDLIASVKKLQTLPHKSPLIAGLLSIVPGGGHVYIEQPLIGFSALIWNALFGYALYEAIMQRQVGIAITLGLFETMWYAGSIFGAVNGAVKYNRDAHRNAMDALRVRFDDRPESWPPAPARAADAE